MPDKLRALIEAEGVPMCPNGQPVECECLVCRLVAEISAAYDQQPAQEPVISTHEAARLVWETESDHYLNLDPKAKAAAGEHLAAIVAAIHEGKESKG